MSTFSARRLLERRLADPAFRARWESTELARGVAAGVVRFRAERGLTPEGLAELWGFTPSQVARLESGEVNPGPRMLLRLVRWLGDPDALLPWRAGTTTAHGPSASGLPPAPRARGARPSPGEPARPD